ncbi:MAG: helix-turn-helix transcriptional regulator [Methanobacteriota archaeon]
MLDADERRLVGLVRDRGGDVTQGDLVTLSGFSKAKVSRVLDRLEAKSLVVRLRRGMTNRIVLAPAEPVP